MTRGRSVSDNITVVLREALSDLYAAESEARVELSTQLQAWTVMEAAAHLTPRQRQ